MSINLLFKNNNNYGNVGYFHTNFYRGDIYSLTVTNEQCSFETFKCLVCSGFYKFISTPCATDFNNDEEKDNDNNRY